MDMNHFIVAVAVAVFSGLIGALLGHCKRRKDDNSTIMYWASESLKNEDKAAELSADLGQLREELELVRDSRTRLGKWQDAVIELLVINQIYKFEHDNDPMKALVDLISYENKIALDPAVSKAAQNLITRGVRKANKKNREKLLEADVKYAASLEEAESLAESSRRAMYVAKRETSEYEEAVARAAISKMKLPGVQAAFKREVEAQRILVRDERISAECAA